jgi:hypothetical protein
VVFLNLTTARSKVMSRFPHWRSQVSLGFLAVLACSDSSSPGNDSQGIDFGYAGELGGHFRAVGPATAAGDPTRSFAVAFRSAAGEVQLCAYQHERQGTGNFLLLNSGVITAPGKLYGAVWLGSECLRLPAWNIPTGRGS